jgi:hypothetical protein
MQNELTCALCYPDAPCPFRYADDLVPAGLSTVGHRPLGMTARQGSDSDLVVEGRDAGEDIGDHRYLYGVLGKCSAVTGPMPAGVADDRLTGADLR